MAILGMASQILHISIDRFGRVVLPKKIRDHLHIKEGTDLEVEEQENAILLKPVVKKAKIIRKNGIPVIELGEPLSRETVEEILKKARRL